MAAGTGGVTVGAGAGFAGDRVEPAVELARSGAVDAVVLECLAERTMIGGLLERAADPDRGYDRRLRRRLAPLLPAAVAARCAVVTNLGSANPAAAAREIAALGRELGLTGLRVAAVLGDDIVTGAAAVDWQAGQPGDWLGVHAYLGVTPIAAALADGADVVVTGRVADSALFAAPAVAFLGLDPGDPEVLAGPITAGHLLECGPQLTGGNLADMRKDALSAAEYAEIGYPIAAVHRDGTAELSVLDGKPARLDTIGATLQLLYEVHDPRAYRTPDVILDFSELEFEPAGVNRVRVTGTRARGRPERLKAVGFRRGAGVVADMEIGYAGDGCAERARAAGEVVRIRLAALGIRRCTVDYVGLDSVLGSATPPPAAPPPELRVHVSAVCESAELAQAVEDELYTLTIAGPAGGCALRSETRPHLEVVSGLVDRDRVRPTVEWSVA